MSWHPAFPQKLKGKRTKIYLRFRAPEIEPVERADFVEQAGCYGAAAKPRADFR